MHQPVLRTSALTLCLLLTACTGTTLLPPDHRLPDGSTHSGDTRNGLFHGRGEQRFPDGTVYRGEFREGYWHGEGELIAPDDWRYEGEFRQGMMAGQGVMTADDRRYEGEFHENDFHGQGRFESDHQGVIEGTFVDGEPSHATQRINDGEYRGEFRDWRWHGRGRWENAEGGVYEGTFVEGRLTGTGEYTGPDGEHYRGEFRDSMFHGEGVLERPDGTRIETTFEYGRPTGKGVLYRPAGNDDPQGTEGRWHRGDFIPEGAPSPREKREAVNQRILARDAQRLQAQLDALAPQRPGRADVYFLGVGGDGSESVFRRDLHVAHDTLNNAFDIEQRAVRLLNDRDYEQFPLATPRAIGQALNRLDDVMDPEEDLLFIHLTSHGGREGAIKLHQPGLDLPNLTPAALRAQLDELAVRHKAVMVSACFSGHWLDALESENTLIMTASRHDRPALGCGENSEMTWFTRALYHDTETFSLANPETLFGQAADRIRQWENEEGLSDDGYAYPQFHLGERMRDYLGQWFRK